MEDLPIDTKLRDELTALLWHNAVTGGERLDTMIEQVNRPGAKGTVPAPNTLPRFIGVIDRCEALKRDLLKFLEEEIYIPGRASTTIVTQVANAIYRTATTRHTAAAGGMSKDARSLEEVPLGAF
jgi:hypothetical protein